MTKDVTQPEGNSIAARMAEALAKVGVTSDEVEPPHNPHMGVFHAFVICHGGQAGKALLELKERLGAPSPQYHGKLVEYCQRALRRHDMPDELRELVTFALGYFSALVDYKIRESKP